MSRSRDPGEPSDGFLSRWSQRKSQVRKSQVRQGQAPPQAATTAAAAQAPAPAVVSIPAAPAPVASAPVATERAAPLTLDDVAQLGRDSDYRRFVAGDVTPEVKNAALKKLFADPHFNVMDGLDIYIDDYGKPDPIPQSMLRQMVQARALGLFAEEEEKNPAAAPSPAGVAPDGAPSPAGDTPDGAPAADTAQSSPQPEPAHSIAHDQDAAVRLQPLDAAGPPGAAGGPEQDAGRQR